MSLEDAHQYRDRLLKELPPDRLIPKRQPNEVFAFGDLTMANLKAWGSPTDPQSQNPLLWPQIHAPKPRKGAPKVDSSVRPHSLAIPKTLRMIVRHPHESSGLFSLASESMNANHN